MASFTSCLAATVKPTPVMTFARTAPSLAPALALSSGLKKEPAGKGMALTGVILNGLMIAGWVMLVMLLLGVGMFGTAAAVNGTA